MAEAAAASEQEYKLGKDLDPLPMEGELDQIDDVLYRRETADAAAEFGGVAPSDEFDSGYVKYRHIIAEYTDFMYRKILSILSYSIHYCFSLPELRRCNTV